MNTDLDRIKNVLTTQLQRQDITANNLSNANTIGFKRDEVFMEVLKGQERSGLKTTTATSFDQGTLRQTSNPLDLALSGHGFFTVDNDGVEAYTRDGHFNVDEFGRLCSTNGALVLGNNGPINVSLNGVTASEISVSTNGEVYLNGQFSDQLRIVDFELPGDLQKIGANQFVATAANPVIEQATPEIHQGFLEESNVNTVQEIISLMDLQRQFESAQRVVRTVDEALSQAIKAADYR